MERSTIRQTALVIACGLGFVTLLGVGSYGLRTQSVVDSTLRTQFRRAARGLELSIHIGSSRPAGLTGMSLQNVQLQGDRAGIEWQLYVERLEVHPDWTSLARGELEVGDVLLESGELQLRRTRLSSSPVETRAASSSTSSRDSDGSGSVSRWASHLEVLLREIEVRALLPRRDLRTRPVALHRLTLELDPEAPLSSLRARGYGTWPGETSFAVSTQWPKASRAPTPSIVLEPERPLAWRPLLVASSREGSTWRRWLEGVSIGGVSTCPGCSPHRICLERPRWRLPQPYTLRSSRLCGSLDGGEFDVQTEAIRLLREGRLLPHRLEDLALSGRLSLEHLDARLQVESSHHGRASMRAHWREGRHLEVTATPHQLHLAELWRALDLREHLQGGILEGRCRLQFDHTLGMATIESRLTYRRGRMHHDLIGDRTLDVSRARLEGRAIADLEPRALSIPEATLTLADTAPLEISGSLVEADPGWSFDTHLETHEVRAPQLLDVLPRPLAAPARGARLEGGFDASIHASGHTAFPESLRLTVDVQGEVDVLRDSPYSNVFKLALNGPPPNGLPARPLDLSLRQWVELDSLPDHVPRTIIAAEDSRFYKHRGFNWRGVRNAIAHNLEVGALERGGSTITQQLAKNLFLTRDRTLARKFRELWVTWRLESVLSKDRLLELYVNIVEWTPSRGRGLRSATRHYFGAPPEELTIPQTTLLGAILPGPQLYGTLIDHGYLPSSRVEKVEHILSNLRFWEIISPTRYTEIYERAKRGEIGGLELTICKDDRHAPAGAPVCSKVPPHDG